MHKTKIVNLSKLFISQGDRYLGMTAAMTQIPVPTANQIPVSLHQKL